MVEHTRRAFLGFGLSMLIAACGLPAPSSSAQPTVAATFGGQPTPTAVATAAPSPPPTIHTRYVATTGSDQANGAIEHPFRTIQAAVDASGPGDAVVIHGGTYDPFSIAVGGRSDAPFTVSSAAGETVLIQGSTPFQAGVRVARTSSWVTVQGLTVTGVTGYRSAGVLVESVVDGPITLSNLIVTGNDGYGINVYESQNVLVENSDLSHNGTGIQVIREGSGVVIRGNQIHENDRMIRNTPQPTNDDYGAEGVTLDGTAGPVLVTDNRIWGNRAASDDYLWDGGAFSIFGASRVTITANTMWDNENVLETGTDGAPCGGNAFTRNVAWGDTSQGRSWGLFLRCGQDMLVAHNTIVGLESFAFSLGDDNSAFAGSVAGLRIQDNIVSLSGGAKVFGLPAPGSLPGDVTIDNDLIWDVGGPVASIGGQRDAADLGAFRAATGYETIGISADPLFRNPGGDDYRLTLLSPAIDRGIPISGLSEPFSGTAPDIGRWEYVPGT
jgi:Right handed beta helix region